MKNGEISPLYVGFIPDYRPNYKVHGPVHVRTFPHLLCANHLQRY